MEVSSIEHKSDHSGCVSLCSEDPSDNLNTLSELKIVASIKKIVPKKGKSFSSIPNKIASQVSNLATKLPSAKKLTQETPDEGRSESVTKMKTKHVVLSK
jgi:hypothetical protein